MDYRQTPRGGWRMIYDKWDRIFAFIIFAAMMVLFFWIIIAPNNHAG
jgi:hypothetical protein